MISDTLSPTCGPRQKCPPFSSCRKVNEDKTVLVMVKQLQESVDKLELLRAEVRVLARRA